jgi:hypothetical protein
MLFQSCVMLYHAILREERTLGTESGEGGPEAPRGRGAQAHRSPTHGNQGAARIEKWMK